MSADAFDVIVVGAGPAGSVSALQLARAGHRVLLLDRHVFPRAKACGDCLSPEVTRQLDALGVLRRLEAARPARLDGWRIYAPDGAHFSGSFARAAGDDTRVQTALAVQRRDLDAVLVRAAQDAGATLWTGARVDDMTWRDGAASGVIARDRAGRRKSVMARLVIGADGLRSIVARRIGATAPVGAVRKHSFTVHPSLPAAFTGTTGEMHVVPHGCIGIAPTGPGDPAVCNVTFVTRSGVRAGDARAVMRAMADDAPGLHERRATLFEAIDAAPPPHASGPFDRPTRFVARDGVALVGDAAGYYDPFTGQGVCHAIGGAMQLALAANRALERDGSVRGSDLSEYTKWLRRWRRPARAVQGVIEFVTSRPRLMDRCTRVLDRAPAFADTLVGVTGDIAPVRSLAGPPLVQLGAAALSHSRSFA